MRLVFGILFLGGLCGGCGQAGSSDQEAALRRCKEQAEKLAGALVAQDFQEYLDRIYPPVLETMGGRDRVMAELKKVRQKATFKVLQLKVEAPDSLIIAGSDVMAIVPVEMELLRAKKTIKGPSYFLGISSDQGKSWTFVDGSNLDARKLRAIVRHFPRSVKLPEVQLDEKPAQGSGG